LNPEAVDAIPGKPNDRKTPLGIELDLYGSDVPIA
jgi:hypothetical protein